jgi:hypothetical protein
VLTVGSAATLPSVPCIAYRVGHHRMSYTGRILLTLMGLGVLGIAIPDCRKMLGQILFSPRAPQVPSAPPLGNPFKHGSKSLVVMVHGTDVPAMVVALGLIKAFGRWDRVTAKSVWEQGQIR